ncbi:MAG: dihydroxyacetone kinase subunit L [Anaerolineae bacterium]|nr:dihydroxyacetone kinase subunit L [Anaerolineae bacterium]
MLLHVAARMQETADLLTQADRAVGDGDHGVGMARGFAAVAARLRSAEIDLPGDALQAAGTALLTSVGGAAGAIFGTLFRAGAAALRGRETLDAAGLADFLEEALTAVQRRGKAAPGDKTVVDALAPAAEAARSNREAPLPEALRAAGEAAWSGVEATKSMVARIGKAKTLGERSLGHPDPGALSLCLILRYMLEYLTGLGQT